MSKPMVSPELARYITEFAEFAEESPARQKLREETQKMPRAGMQLDVGSASFLAWLAKLIGAKRTLEIGTFTGYSALAVAEVLPADGKLVACDVSAEWTAIGRRHWDAAGVGHKIELKLGPAIETLRSLAPGFDLAFIDADKTNYDAYYERCLELVRPGGVIVFDNVLWSGAVVKPEDEDGRALHALNQKVAADERVDRTLLTVGDGLLLARRRS
jgi:predicted O-methyltransferase YrrM